MKNRLFSSAPVSLDFGLLLMRLGFGGLMFGNHGWLKLLRLGQDPVQFYPFMGLDPWTALLLAALTESFFSLLVVFGLGTRWAVFPLIFILLVAIFGALAAEPFGKRELAIVFLVGFSVLHFTGAGKYSLDGYITRRIGKRSANP